jgi:hypothetical protein
LDYFEAVQQGRARAKAAIDLLQAVAGPSYPMLFLKLGYTDWTPVGSEMLYSVLPGKAGTAAVVVCDSEGNSKAMTSWVTEPKAQQFANELAAKGLTKYEGEVRLPI